MKNYRTPRTIAECDFTTGYPIDNPNEAAARRSDIYLAVICVLVAGLMLWGII